MPLIARTATGRPVECSTGRLALLVIDMQRDFCDPASWYSSTMDERGGEEIRYPIPAIRRLLDAARAAGVLVLHTREGHAPDLSDLDEAKAFRYEESGLPIGGESELGRLLIRGEPGHLTIDELAPIEGEPVIDKTGQDAFAGSALAETLEAKGITHLLVTGVTASCCVHSTLRAATDRGYYATMVGDAVGSFAARDREMAVAMVEAENGALGFLTWSDDIVSELESA